MTHFLDAKTYLWVRAIGLTSFLENLVELQEQK